MPATVLADGVVNPAGEVLKIGVNANKVSTSQYNDVFRRRQSARSGGLDDLHDGVELVVP
jgi:hypothetical protein